MFADLIFASVWAAVVVLKFAVAYVSPSGIVIDGSRCLLLYLNG
jgi:hypothetical protein